MSFRHGERIRDQDSHRAIAGQATLAGFAPATSLPAGAHAEEQVGRRTCAFVALSRFTIANGMAAEVRRAFAERPHLVEQSEGFLGLHVMSPVENEAEIWLVTRWADEQSYRTWHRGHTYHESHAGIPKGLKLVAASTEIRFFDLFAE